MDNKLGILVFGIAAVAVVLFIKNSQQAQDSSSLWDSLNPLNWIASGEAAILQPVTSEINTLVYILVGGVVVIVAFLAFGKNDITKNFRV